jgi:hypothetical protein
MSIKETISEKMVKELYGIMSSPHFMRLSNAFWRMRNEFEVAKSSKGPDIGVILERLERSEEKVTQLQAKLEALEGLVAKGTRNKSE